MMHILEYSNIFKETIKQKMLVCFRDNLAIRKQEMELGYLSFLHNRLALLIMILKVKIKNLELNRSKIQH